MEILIFNEFFYISVENLSELNRIHKYMHSALVTRNPEHVHWLAHFCWGLLIVTTEKGKATEISYSDARSLVTFFSGDPYSDNRERVFMFDYDTKEKEQQNSRRSDLYSEATPPFVQIR
jgi:hypothetical protein